MTRAPADIVCEEVARSAPEFARDWMRREAARLMAEDETLWQLHGDKVILEPLFCRKMEACAAWAIFIRHRAPHLAPELNHMTVHDVVDLMRSKPAATARIH